MKYALNKISIVLGTFLILCGCSLLPKEEEPLEPPLVEPASTEYETEEVESEELVDAFEAKGSFESDDEVDITTPDEGQEVEEVNVESNDEVDEGDTLVELEVGDLPLDIRQQKLSVSEAELSLETAQENIDDNDELKADIEELKDERDELKEKRDDTDDPEKEEEIKNEISEKEGKIESKDEQIQKDTELNQEVESADIELEREQNDLEDLEEKLDAATMTAPISGVVTSLEDIKEGEELEPDTTIATISDPDSLRLETSDDRDEWDDISSGMDAEVTIGDEELSGEVAEVPDEDSDDNLTVDVGDIPDSVDLGESADIKIIFEKREDALTVPPEAIRDYDEQAVVRTLEDGDLSEVSVETGLELDDKVEIVNGLDEGDEVVLR